MASSVSSLSSVGSSSVVSKLDVAGIQKTRVENEKNWNAEGSSKYKQFSQWGAWLFWNKKYRSTKHQPKPHEQWKYTKVKLGTGFYYLPIKNYYEHKLSKAKIIIDWSKGGFKHREGVTNKNHINMISLNYGNINQAKDMATRLSVGAIVGYELGVGIQRHSPYYTATGNVWQSPSEQQKNHTPRYKIHYGVPVYNIGSSGVSEDIINLIKRGDSLYHYDMNTGKKISNSATEAALKKHLESELEKAKSDNARDIGGGFGRNFTPKQTNNGIIGIGLVLLLIMIMKKGKR